MNVSSAAKEFISTSLTSDPARRPTAGEMLEHPWLADETPHFVPDLSSRTRGPRDLLPHIRKRLEDKISSEFYFIHIGLMLTRFHTRSPPHLRLLYHLIVILIVEHSHSSLNLDSCLVVSRVDFKH